MPPADRPSWLRRMLRSWAAQEDLRKELAAAAILGLLPLIGFAGWMLSRGVSDFELEQNIRQEYLVNELNDRREALADFADEIPKNSFIIASLGAKRIWIEAPYTNPAWQILERNGGPSGAAAMVYRDGRTLQEVQQAYDDEVSRWLLELSHYSALTQGVSVRFNLEELQRRSSEETAVAASLQARLEALDAVLSAINAVGASAASLSELEAALARADALLPREMQAAAAAARLPPDPATWGPLAEPMAALDNAATVVDDLYTLCLRDMQSLLRLSRQALIGEQ